MKKLVLVLILAFGFVNLSNAKQESSSVLQSINKLESVPPSTCWTIADAIEARHCGYVGCDGEWWLYAYDECMNVQK